MEREILQQGKGTEYDGPNGPYIVVEEMHRAAVDGVLHVHVPGDAVPLEAAKVSGLAKGKPAKAVAEPDAAPGAEAEGEKVSTYPVKKAAAAKKPRSRK